MTVFGGGEFHSTMKFWMLVLLGVYCLKQDFRICRIGGLRANFCLNVRRIWGFCWGVSSSTPQLAAAADFKKFCILSARDPAAF